jgi:hypothetical protein
MGGFAGNGEQCLLEIGSSLEFLTGIGCRAGSGRVRWRTDG